MDGVGLGGSDAEALAAAGMALRGGERRGERRGFGSGTDTESSSSLSAAKPPGAVERGPRSPPQ
jgi:hypothetical protein